jgi:hypothetical protein
MTYRQRIIETYKYASCHKTLGMNNYHVVINGVCEAWGDTRDKAWSNAFKWYKNRIAVRTLRKFES